MGYEPGREEGHVSGGDEDETVPGGDHTGLDTRERALSTGTSVWYAVCLGRGIAAGDEHLFAAGGEGGTDPVEQGDRSDLKGKLILTHPTALSAGQDQASRRRLSARRKVQEPTPRVRPPPNSPIRRRNRSIFICCEAE